MITSKIISGSKSYFTGTKITTFEVSIHRYVLSELNTHRMLSRNSSSSRAVPIESNIDNILKDTAIPIHWGLNQPGMVADDEIDYGLIEQAKLIWLNARDNAIKSALELKKLGIHKQVANRLVEPFSYQKIIITATEWDNFFWLRNHKDAQPEFRYLANMMLEQYNNFEFETLYKDEWHTPYVKHHRCPDGILYYLDSNDNNLTKEEALQISASCSAQVSYRKNDDTLDKADTIFNMLNLFNEGEETRKHSSPIEHQATPFDLSNFKGITNFTEDDSWSGNFKNWIQYRHTFKNESCKNNPNLKK